MIESRRPNELRQHHGRPHGRAGGDPAATLANLPAAAPDRVPTLARPRAHTQDTDRPGKASRRDVVSLRIHRRRRPGAR